MSMNNRNRDNVTSPISRERALMQEEESYHAIVGARTPDLPRHLHKIAIYPAQEPLAAERRGISTILLCILFDIVPT